LASEQEALLLHTFHELQEMGLIASTRRLYPFKHGNKHCPHFQAALVRRSRIYYWLNDSKLERDGLRFVLLHEERHLRGYLSSTAYFVSFIAWTSFLLYLYLTVHFPEKLWAVVALLYLVGLWYSMMPYLMIDERRSDLWATRCLKNRFGVACPSRVVAKAMDFPPLLLSPEDRLIMRVKKALHTDYHPTKEKRIELIAREVDDCED